MSDDKLVELFANAVYELIQSARDDQVTACTSYRCPLYPVRPATKAGESATLEGVEGADLAGPESRAA